MKNKTIDKLLQANHVMAFDFENDDYMVAWYVTPAEGKLIGKRVVETEDGDVFEAYVKVPYANLDRCEGVYEAILQDFVGCYGEDLYYGCAECHSLFSDFASPDDCGLEWVLSVFGKTYTEFLLDLFFWYGKFVEEYPYLLLDEEPPVDPKDVELKKVARLTRKVLALHVDATLTFIYADDTQVRWEFAIEHDRLWYHRAYLAYTDEDTLECTDEYGNFDIADPEHWGALHDVVLGLYEYEGVEEVIELGDPLGLIGINPDDLED